MFMNVEQCSKLALTVLWNELPGNSEFSEKQQPELTSAFKNEVIGAIVLWIIWLDLIQAV